MENENKDVTEETKKENKEEIKEATKEETKEETTKEETNVLTLVSPIGICYCYHIPISNFNCVARHDSVCSKGIGDIPQQAKCVRVITKALLTQFATIR